MACGNKRKDKCGKKVNSVCVKYEGDLPEFSELTSEDCPVVEEVLEDIYSHIGDIKESVDLSGLGESCITYTPQGEDLQVSDALIRHEELLCDILGDEGDSGTATGSSGGLDMSQIDTKCLTDPCGSPITTPEALIQAMIDKMCDCCGGDPAQRIPNGTLYG